MIACSAVVDRRPLPAARRPPPAARRRRPPLPAIPSPTPRPLSVPPRDAFSLRFFELIGEMEKLAPLLAEEKLGMAAKRVGVMAAAANEEDGEKKALLAQMEAALSYEKLRQLFKISGLFYAHKAASHLS